MGDGKKQTNKQQNKTQEHTTQHNKNTLKLQLVFT